MHLRPEEAKVDFEASYYSLQQGETVVFRLQYFFLYKLSIVSDLHSLNSQEKELDSLIEQMHQSFQTWSTTETNRSLSYVHYEDIRNLVDFHNRTVIAIKAPTGSVLEVPDPSEAGVCQIYSSNFRNNLVKIQFVILRKFKCP